MSGCRERDVFLGQPIYSGCPFMDGSLRGYIRFEVTPQRWTATYQAVEGVTQSNPAGPPVSGVRD